MLNDFAMPQSRYIFASLPWYSVTMVTGIIVALLWACHEEKRLKLPKDTIVDLALWLIPCGVVGARLYYVVFAWDTFAGDPLSVLYIWRGGLAIYGAILGGLAAAAVFAKRRKLALLTLSDMIVPGLVLAQAIGRWGNYFNMEAFGVAVSDPAWQFFPAAVLIQESGGTVWHMATFFYESCWDLLVFVLLACTRKHLHRTGDCTLLYAGLYGAGRLVVEGLRLDSLMTTGGNGRVSQLLSVALCLTAIVIFTVYALKGRARRGFAVYGAAAVLIAVGAYLLRAPEDAFFLSRFAFAAKTGLVLGAVCAVLFTGERRVTAWLRFLPLVLCTVLEVFLRCRMAALGASGIGAATVQCLLLSLTILTALLGLYPATSPRALCAEGPSAI